jgi:hypothetical protein
MAKNLSRDQKRKAKLVERDKRAREMDVFTPYSGRKYQSDHWAPVVFATERPIYDVIVESKRALTNAQVRRALELLIDHLRRGGPPGIGDAEPVVPYSTGNAAECVFHNIRRSWRQMFDSGRTVAATDLIGVARTLLYSIEAHGNNTGQARGYVAFLQEFLPPVIRETEIGDALTTMELIRNHEAAPEGMPLDGDVQVIK